MTRLYPLVLDHRKLERVVNNPACTSAALLEVMAGLSGDVEQAAKSIAATIQNLESEAEATAKASRAMASRAKKDKERAEFMRSYLLTRMIETGTSRVRSKHFVIAVIDNPAEAEITNAELVPAKFHKEQAPLAIALDLCRIATALTDCELVPGATIRYTKRLDIFE